MSSDYTKFRHSRVGGNPKKDVKVDFGDSHFHENDVLNKFTKWI